MISTLTDIRSEVSWSDLYIMDLMNSYKNLYIYIYIYNPHVSSCSVDYGGIL